MVHWWVLVHCGRVSQLTLMHNNKTPTKRSKLIGGVITFTTEIDNRRFFFLPKQLILMSFGVQVFRSQTLNPKPTLPVLGFISCNG